MKYLLLLSLLLTAGCQDNLRTRAPLCPNNICADALSVRGGKLVAEISIEVSFSKSQLYFMSSDSSVDSDDDQKCEISAENGKRFTYKINGDKLTLKDGFNNMTLVRSGGYAEEGLLNLWILPATAKNDQIEMEFITDTILRIRKVCLKS